MDMPIMSDPAFAKAREILDKGMRDKKEMRGVARLLSTVRKEYHEDPMLLNAYARLYRRTGEPGRLYDALMTAQTQANIETYPSPWANLALFWEDFHLWQRARTIYEEVLRFHPDDLFARERIEKCVEQTKSICKELGISFPPSGMGDLFLVRVLEALMAAGVYVKKAKCRLEDDIGLEHEIDLLCDIHIFGFLEQAIPLVIECKDWSRSISRPVVDQFRSFLDHSRYKLGMIIVSGDLTENARKEAETAGILTYTLSELESKMDSVLRRRITDYKAEWIRDWACTKGPSEEERAREAAAIAKFIHWAEQGDIADQPELAIDERGIHIGEQRILWFEKDELQTCEDLVGPLASASLPLVLLLMSWWNNIDDLAHYAYAVPPWQKDGVVSRIRRFLGKPS